MTSPPELFAVDIEKRLGSEYWSNRYIVASAQFSNAVAFADDIVQVERSFHADAVTFTRARISTVDQTDDRYTIVPLQVQGLRDNGGSILPLFNTLRFDLPAASGRPSRKYYRGVLTELDIEGDAITTDFSVFVPPFNAALLAPEGDRVVDPQGQTLFGPVVVPLVQMRQLRRSSRRRNNGSGIFQ